MLGLAVLATALTPTPPTPPRKRSDAKLPRLMVLSTMPIAFGAYGPAVQLAGGLSDPHAVLLQCGTYSVAVASVGLIRAVRERSVKVSRVEWRAGCELGMWITCAAIFEVLGLQRTSAARAGFLVRLSTVLVPLVEAALRRRWLSRLMTVAVGTSLAGVLLMVSQAGGASAALSGGSTLVGDGLMGLAALFYSGHILRMSTLAPRCGAWPLATAKAATQLFASQVALALFCVQHGGAAGFAPPPLRVWRIALFLGTVTCAWPLWAQGFGQAGVRASHVSLIYATSPGWTALLAWAVLGQQLSSRALLGAGFMMAGAALSIVASATGVDDAPLERLEGEP